MSFSETDRTPDRGRASNPVAGGLMAVATFKIVAQLTLYASSLTEIGWSGTAAPLSGPVWPGAQPRIRRAALADAKDKAQREAVIRVGQQLFAC